MTFSNGIAERRQRRCDAMIRQTLAAVALCGALLGAACGDSPTAPTQPSAPATGTAAPADAVATLAVVVVGHVRNAPLAGVAVRIDPIGSVRTADVIEQTTGADGRVSWHVIPGQRYTIRVRNLTAITDALLQADAQWLVSLPE